MMASNNPDGGSHLAVLGATAVLLAIGFEPFIQTLVYYSPELGGCIANLSPGDQYRL